MLVDSADCVTFAYISNECLEVGNLRCRNPNPNWDAKIHVLKTAVHSLEGTDSRALRPAQAYFFPDIQQRLVLGSKLSAMHNPGAFALRERLQYRYRLI